MCNRLHDGSEEIPTKGKGWKIFTSKNNLGMVLYNKYNKNGSGQIVWSNETKGDGFCFFMTRKEARKAIKDWKSVTSGWKREPISIKRIEYKQGLGKHLEDPFMYCKYYQTALCKEFKIIGK